MAIPKQLATRTKVGTQTATKLSILVVSLAAVLSGGALLAQASGFAPGFSLAATTLNNALLPQITLAGSAPASINVVSGQTDALVGTYKIATPIARNIAISKIALHAFSSASLSGPFAAGGQANSLVKSCNLKNGQGAVLAGPSTIDAAGNLIFNTSFTIPMKSMQVLSVFCDFNTLSGSATGYLSLDLAATPDADTDPNNFTPDITASNPANSNAVLVRLNSGDDRSLNGGTNPRQKIIVKPAGGLTVTTDPNSPTAKILLTGSVDNNVTNLKFAAADEAFTVTTLTLTEEQATDDFGATGKSTYARSLASLKIDYQKADGSRATKVAALTGNEAKFSGLDIFVPAGGTSSVKVYADIAGAGRTGAGTAVSNDRLRIGFSTDNINNDNFAATGVSSGRSLNDHDILPVGDDATDGIATFVVRETKPTITIASNTPSGMKTPGRLEALSFNVSAAANEDVQLASFIFELGASDGAGSGWNACDIDGTMTTSSDFDLYNFTVDGTSATIEDQNAGTWTILGPNGAACNTTNSGAVSFAKLTLGVPVVIPAGSTINFKLYFDSTGISTSFDDIVRFSLPADPIALSYLPLGTPRTTSGSMTASTNTLVGSGALDTSGSNAVATGDLVKINDEVMLVVEHAAGTSSATVIRGYLGTSAASHAAGQAITRIPGSFLWRDNGDVGMNSSLHDYWSGYLVGSLPQSGGALFF